MRPLYIDGLPGCRVVLDEPALRIVGAGQGGSVVSVVADFPRGVQGGGGMVDAGLAGLRRCRYHAAVFGEQRRGACALAGPWR